MNEANRAILERVKAYIEYAELKMEHEWGSYNTLEDLIKNDDMDDCYAELVGLIAEQDRIAAERAKPVDLAWLTSIGGEWDENSPFAVVFDIPTKIIKTPMLLRCSDYANAADCPWDVAHFHEDGTMNCTMIAEQLPTRGEVLDLLAALKIEVKEPPCT